MAHLMRKQDQSSAESKTTVPGAVAQRRKRMRQRHERARHVRPGHRGGQHRQQEKPHVEPGERGRPRARGRTPARPARVTRGMSVRTCESSCVCYFIPCLSSAYARGRDVTIAPGPAAKCCAALPSRTAISSKLETSKRSERNTFASVAVSLHYLHRRAAIDPNGKPHSGKARLELRPCVRPMLLTRLPKPSA